MSEQRTWDEGALIDEAQKRHHPPFIELILELLNALEADNARYRAALRHIEDIAVIARDRQWTRHYEGILTAARSALTDSREGEG